MQSEFLQILRDIGEQCEAQSLTEAEVEKLFQEQGFFTHLEYEGIGKDILAQRGRSRKRYDVALMSFGGRVQAVIEFKQPGAGPLEAFREELYVKYVRPHIAPCGVLTNGQTLILYTVHDGELREHTRTTLARAQEAETREIETWLRKKTIDLTVLDSIIAFLKTNHRQPLLLSSGHSDDVDQSFRFDADQIGAKRRRPLSV